MRCFRLAVILAVWSSLSAVATAHPRSRGSRQGRRRLNEPECGAVLPDTACLSTAGCNVTQPGTCNQLNCKQPALSEEAAWPEAGKSVEHGLDASMAAEFERGLARAKAVGARRLLEQSATPGVLPGCYTTHAPIGPLPATITTVLSCFSLRTGRGTSQHRRSSMGDPRVCATDAAARAGRRCPPATQNGGHHAVRTTQGRALRAVVSSHGSPCVPHACPPSIHHAHPQAHRGGRPASVGLERVPRTH